MRMHEALRTGWAALAQAGIPSPALDAELLLAFVRGMERATLLADRQTALPAHEAQRYAILVARRAKREPLAYLTGEKDFFGRPFTVTPAVLIPRPESELLVEAALARLPRQTALMVADIGTGSGCLGVTLACERPMVRVLATDVSADALTVAHRNADRHRVAARCDFRTGDLFLPVADDTLDLIVANLPYVPNEEVAANPDLAYEPLIALRGARTPEKTYRRFLEQWHARGAQPTIVLEIHPNLAAFVRTWCRNRGIPCTIEQDLAGRDRLAVVAEGL